MLRLVNLRRLNFVWDRKWKIWLLKLKEYVLFLKLKFLIDF